MTGSATARPAVIVVMLDVATLGVVRGIYSYTGVGAAPLYGGLVVIRAHARTGIAIWLTQAFGYSGPTVIPLTQARQLFGPTDQPFGRGLSNLLQQLANQNVLFPPVILESTAVISAIV
jgi:hypothetical protein